MIGQEEMASSCARGGLDGILGKISLLRCCQALEQGAQGCGGVTIPGGIQKACRQGTSGHGLVGVVDGWTQ